MWKSMINSSTAAKGNTDLLQKHFQVGVNNLTRSLEENRNETILVKHVSMKRRVAKTKSQTVDQQPKLRINI